MKTSLSLVFFSRAISITISEKSALNSFLTFFLTALITLTVSETALFVTGETIQSLPSNFIVEPFKS